MANHKSALKRIRQNEKRRDRNRKLRATIRTAVKNVRAAVTAGNKDEAQNAFKTAEKLLARGTSKGVHHKNNGARRTSRLAKAVASIS